MPESSSRSRTLVLHQRVPVTFTYGVHFTEDVFAPGNAVLADVVRGRDGPAKALVVLDSGLIRAHPDLAGRIAAYARAHADALVLAAAPLAVPGGEAAKNDPGLVDRLHRAISDGGICRHSYVVAVGGGAVLDLAGYAAATAHRGVRLVRVPTTVLAQNDSGVGVKNGINAFGKKNFLGSFAPPHAVINDPAFLDTLDDRDWRSGLAEAVKVALIRDIAFFSFIANRAAALAGRDRAAMRRLVQRCAQLHLEHIAGAGDPFEQGTSRPLDFGHWSAHRLEAMTGHRLRHGEAVAVGIALDATYSHLAGLLSEAAWRQALDLLEALGFALWVPEMDDFPALFQGLEEFREHLGGRLTVMLLAGIGQGVEVHAVDRDLYGEAIGILRRRASCGSTVTASFT